MDAKQYDEAAQFLDEIDHTITHVRCDLPLGHLAEFLQSQDVPDEVRETLDKLERCASVLVYDGPEFVDAVATALGMTAFLTARREAYAEEVRRDREHIARVLGKNE